MSPPAEIAAQLDAATDVLRRHLGADQLHAIHLFGSALHGGLRPHSDIDLLVTIRQPLAEAQRHALMRDLLTVSAWPGTSATLRALEVTVLVHRDVRPWRYAPRRELQFGEWLREDLLAGRTEPPLADHDLAILLTEVRQHGIALCGPPPGDVLEPVPPADLQRALRDTLAQWNQPADWQGDERNVVLALARIWYTEATGGIAPKDVAAAWALARLPAEHHDVVATARGAYLGEGPDDLAARPAEIAAFVSHLKARLFA